MGTGDTRAHHEPYGNQYRPREAITKEPARHQHPGHHEQKERAREGDQRVGFEGSSKGTDQDQGRSAQRDDGDLELPHPVLQSDPLAHNVFSHGAKCSVSTQDDVLDSQPS